MSTDTQHRDGPLPAPQRPALHTIVLSDVHLTEPEPLDPRRPLWKRFKQADLFVDDSLARLLAHLRAEVPRGSELVLAGDIFDFDSVTTVPRPAPFHVSWLEGLRGLAAEEEKSVWKMRTILAGHPTVVSAWRAWVEAGNRLVFLVGNHDLELQWPGVQQVLRDALDLPGELHEQVRVCEWYYISGQDTLVEHGNQYDGYCACVDPVHPFIEVKGNFRLRLPFGNQAGKLMLNGMGLFNPHIESSFIKSVWEYVVFFLRDVRTVQPLLLWSWMWSAVVTLVVVLREGLEPPLRDPLTMDERIESIAERAQGTPRLTRALRALHVHSAVFNPLMLARELWLDRAFLVVAAVWLAFQSVTTVNLFVEVPWWSILVAVAIALPPVLFYARGVNSDVYAVQKAIEGRLRALADLSRVERVVLGHTHVEVHTEIDGIEVLNTGTWSPAYEDVACTRPYGRKCIAWIRPTEGRREASLYEWLDPGLRLVPRSAPQAPTGGRLRMERMRELSARMLQVSRRKT